MNLNQKQQILNMISQRREAICRRYNERWMRLAELNAKVVGDLFDEAIREDSLNTEYTLEEHDLLELRRLDEAQYRIESEQRDFGNCQMCGESIEISRLLIIPETPLCRSCAEKKERQQEVPPVFH